LRGAFDERLQVLEIAAVRAHTKGVKTYLMPIDTVLELPLEDCVAWMPVSKWDSMRMKCGDIIVEGGVSLEVVDKFYVMQGLGLGKRESWLAPPYILTVRSLDVK